MVCKLTRLKYLSTNKKIQVPDFSITLRECKKSCNYYDSNLCYAKNNPNITIWNNPKYVKNEKLLNSKSFVNVIYRELLLSNSRKARFFTNGDMYKISHLEKIEKLCEKLPNIQFWLSTHNEQILYNYYTKENKKPIKNLNVILSYKEINEKPPKLLIQYWNKQGIYISYTTNEISLSNCPASINRGSCDLCSKCYDKKENITYLIHGKHSEKRLKKYEDSKK